MIGRDLIGCEVLMKVSHTHSEGLSLSPSHSLFRILTQYNFRQESTEAKYFPS